MRNITLSLLLMVLLSAVYSCRKDTASCNTSPPNHLSVVSVMGGVYASLRWDSVPSAALGYTMQYRKSGTSTWTQLSATNDTISISGLTPNTTYEWQVQSICSFSKGSAFSPSDTFQTGNLIGSCSLDSTLSFYATNFVSNPVGKSIMVYVNDTSTYITFTFSTYPVSSGTYLMVSPDSSVPGNTAVMKAKFNNGTPSYSTGTDGVSATVTVAGGKVSLNLSKVATANLQNPSNIFEFYDIIINQP